MRRLFYLTVLCAFAAACAPARDIVLLNVSYDPTREFYKDIDAAFARFWKEKTGDSVTVNQSHGGSAKQAGSVINGSGADVVTLGLAYDIDAIHDHANLLPADWQKRLPGDSSPYTSTIVFLVRRGNPKNIKDWGDLITNNVAIIVPDPKTSGGARWAYLAAYGYALKKNNGNNGDALAYITQFYRHVKVLGAGARDSTITFGKNGIGDVLVSWENEALLAEENLGKGQFQIVYPSISILAEPPVALVDTNVDKHGTRDVAQAYLQFLYSAQGQEIAAEHFFRPRDPEVLKKHEALFPPITTFTVDEVFGGWRKAQKTHFDEGGIFDQISRDRH